MDITTPSSEDVDNVDIHDHRNVHDDDDDDDIVILSQNSTGKKIFMISVLCANKF